MPVQLAERLYPLDWVSSDETTPWYWKRVHLFEGVEERGQRAFFDCAKKHEYAKGRHIVFPNDPGSKIFYLKSGLVKIYNLSEHGQATIYWFCVSGEVFGMGGITGCSEQMVFAQAVEESHVFTIGRHKFEELLRAHPQLGLNVMRLMGARLRLACDTVASLPLQSADMRLARQLLRLAENCGHLKHGGVELRAHITHQEFANMIGSCRQTVTVALQHFRDRGLIDMTGRYITILAVRELKDFAEDRGKVRDAHPQSENRSGRSSNLSPTLVRHYWNVR
jgi:CRP-like cAMP-binding protein